MMKAAIEWNHFYGIINIKPIYEQEHERLRCCLPSANTARSRRSPVQFTNGSYITFDFLEDICEMELLKSGKKLCRGEQQHHPGEYR